MVSSSSLDRSSAPANGMGHWVARHFWVVIAALVIVRVVAAGLLLANNASGPKALLTGDIRRYEKLAHTAGRPYRDFNVEYPPITLGVIKVIASGSIEHATTRTVWLGVIADVLVAAGLAYGFGRRAALTYLAFGLVFVWYPFLYMRLDLLSVALSVWGLALTRRKRETAGGVLIALACFAKVWPLALLPILLASGRGRAFRSAMVTGGLGVAVWLAWGGTGALSQVATMRGAKGWQIESVTGWFVHVLSPGPAYGNAGAWRTGIMPPGFSLLSGLAIGVAILLVGVLVAGLRPADRADTGLVFGVAALAAVGCFLAISPLLSPQFACWLAPMGALAWVYGHRRIACITAAIGALSTLAALWLRPYKNTKVVPVIAVGLRNGLLVALILGAIAVLAMRQSDGPPGWIPRWVLRLGALVVGGTVPASDPAAPRTSRIPARFAVWRPPAPELAPDEASATAASGSGRPKRFRGAVMAGGVAIAALILVVPLLQLWRADISVPWVSGPDSATAGTYRGDNAFYLMVVEDLHRHGTYLTNPQLGVPGHQQLYDLPIGLDNLQLAALWGLAAATGSAVIAVNAYYLLTFALVALAAFLVARRLSLAPLPAAAVALLYTFLPYHFVRGTAHLLLAGYFMVPVACLLFMRLLEDVPPFTASGPGKTWRVAFRGRRALAWAAACVLIASTGGYYLTFTLLLALLAGGIGVLVHRNARSLAAAGVVAGLLVAVALVNLAPSLNYWIENGTNPLVARRAAVESGINGLKISDLVLPAAGHRIAALADLTANSRAKQPFNSELGQELGTLGTLGFLALVAVVLVRGIAGRGHDGPTSTMLGRLGVLSLIGVLIGAAWSFSMVLAVLGMTEIRSWNRISVFIAFPALVAVGLVLQRVLSKIGTAGPRRTLGFALVAFVVTMGLLDQVTPAVVPHYASAAAAWHSDAALVSQIDATLPSHAMVFQLPYVSFPEHGREVSMGPYDEAQGFLHSRKLRWSFGATIGRRRDWQRSMSRQIDPDFTDRLVAMGFQGLLVDRAGYKDHGTAVEGSLAVAVGSPSLVSRDRRLAFYDLRPHRLTRRDGSDNQVPVPVPLDEMLLAAG